MDIEQRLEDLEQSVSYLLTQVEGKSKLVQLIDVLRKDNEELHVRCNKLIHENVFLQGSLSQEKVLVKKLRFIVEEDTKHLVLLDKLTSIVDLLNQAELETNNLISKFCIE